MKLTDENCKSNLTQEDLLTSDNIYKLMPEVNSWTLEEKTLKREFTFSNFKKAMAFVVQTAMTAETQNHHPDINITYNKVTLTLTTHKVGGLTRNDFLMAAKIDEL